MKLYRFGVRRALAVVSTTLMLGACGGEASDPKVISVEDLAAPGGLSVIDYGDGSVTLSWVSSNPEEDFQGFNIYGAKGTASELGVTDGEPLKLLDQAGEASSEAKSILEKFDYDSGNSNALPNAPTHAASTFLQEEEEETGGSSSSEPKFKFLPIHTVNGDGEPVLPTCQPDGTGDCIATTESNKKDEDLVTNFGSVRFKVEGLTPGQSYCFLVFSVQDDGEGISQSSSEVRCVVPRIEVNNITFNMTTKNYHSVDLKEVLADCSASNKTCPKWTDAPHYNDSRSAAVTSAATDANLAFFVEAYASDNTVYFVPGKNAAIRDMGGKFMLGFEDPDLDIAPEASFPSGEIIQIGGGYTPPYMSVVLKARHVYVVAVGDPDATTPDSFSYHYIYINQDTDPAKGSPFNVKVRMSLKADER